MPLVNVNIEGQKANTFEVDDIRNTVLDVNVTFGDTNSSRNQLATDKGRPHRHLNGYY
jgi:hypothetical protein